jgi:toxin-antitoxin system PIN domain toxin
MSASLDANILLYASDQSNPAGLKAREILRGFVESGEVFFLAWPTVMAYVRIATHPRIFANPLSHAEAVANIDMLISCPHVRMLGEDDGFWDAYKRASTDVATHGNLVPDTHLATILRQHGVDTIYTRDKDFLKYTWLRVVNPFDT